LATTDVTISSNSIQRDFARISEFAERLLQKPMIAIAAEDLDCLISDTLTDDGLYRLTSEKYVWLGELLPSLQWWMDLSESALSSRDPAYDTKPDPAFAHHRKALSDLLADVFSAYVPAMQEGPSYAEDWSWRHTASLELAKRYHLYTRHVSAFAVEAWPEVPPSWFLDQK